MNACQSWKDCLLDVALGAPVSPGLEKHLRSCDHCAVALVEMRSHCGQMDAGLQQLVRGPGPSPVFLSRLQASLDTQRMQTSFSVWAAALSMGVVAVTLVWFIPKWDERERPGLRLDSSLSDWRSPTASLLRSPVEQLQQSNPRLGEWYFPLRATATERRKERKL